MNISFISVLGIFAAAGLFVLVPVIIGTYVYRDAKSRGMDPVLWTLAAVLVPSFIGLIIYLIVRSNSPGLRCPGCGNPVAGEYALCPYCGMALKASCPSCAAPVNDGWRLCPKCGAELPEQTERAIIPTAPKKDRRLTWILAAAVVIPLVILVIGIVGMVGFRVVSSTAQSMSTGFHIATEDGFVPVEVVSWMEECDAAGKGVYVLEILPEKAAEIPGIPADGHIPEDYYRVYIYMNQLAPGTGLTGAAEVNKKTMEVSYSSAAVAEGKSPGYELSEITAEGQKITALKITIDGAEVEYALKELL